MKTSARTWIFATGGGCAALVVLQLADMPAAAGAAKILASISFILLALSQQATRSRYGRLLLPGLVLSACGDALLIGSSQPFFLAGLGAFLLAHLAYTSAFFVRGINPAWAAAAALPVVAVAFAVGSWLLPLAPAKLALPVLIYIIVISSMLIAAIATRGRGATLLIPVGALMFFVSDLSVALGSIVEASFPHYVWGLPLYYGAEVCLALSVSQSRSH